MVVVTVVAAAVGARCAIAVGRRVEGSATEEEEEAPATVTPEEEDANDETGAAPQALTPRGDEVQHCTQLCPQAREHDEVVQRQAPP